MKQRRKSYVVVDMMVDNSGETPGRTGSGDSSVVGVALPSQSSPTS